MHHIDPTTISLSAFMAKVSLSPKGCWLWEGGKDGDGYGIISVNGVSLRTHRVSYTIFRGEIEDELFICHHCHNPPCVNPEHLFQGTQAENLAGHFHPEQKSIIQSALQKVS